MVRILCYSILGAVLTGCSLITEPPAESHKVCTEMAFTSQLAVSIHSQVVLPEYFSAVVNGVVVDECQTGSPNRYVFKRHNDYNATLTLYAWPDSPFSSTFFDEKGVPYDLGEMNAVFSGRPACDADATVISQVQKPLTWTPIHANGSSCSLSGYLGM